MTIGLTLALVALLLATAGLYSTMAFLVGRRTREIGVRIALGARTTDIRSLVMREGLMLTLVGVASGLVLSRWVGRALRHQLYGIGTLDVPSIIGAAAILVAAALLASWLPARRAARVEPGGRTARILTRRSRGSKGSPSFSNVNLLKPLNRLRKT